LTEPIVQDARPEAALVLADGTVFLGRSFGAPGQAVGEVIFQTDAIGYEEVITDPAYRGRIVTFTYPHIGNVDINAQDMQSDAVTVAALVVRSASSIASNFRSEGSLEDFLKAQGVVAIAEVDTRRLTRHIRRYGAQAGALIVSEGEKVTAEQIAAAQSLSRNASAGAQQAGTEKAYEPQEGAWDIRGPEGVAAFRRPQKGELTLLAYDLGGRRDMWRTLAQAGLRVTVVPEATPLPALLKAAPSGVFLSNGPGAPSHEDNAVAVARACLEHKIPVFGVGKGMLTLALSCGAKLEKLAVGFHGSNYPVRECLTGYVSVVAASVDWRVLDLPPVVSVTHESLVDGSVAAFRFENAPAIASLASPIATEGEPDVFRFLETFIDMMRSTKHA